MVAVALTIVLLLKRISRPDAAVLGSLPDGSGYGDVGRHPEAETVPGLLIFRVDAPLFFDYATGMRDRLRRFVRDADPPYRVILLDLETNSDLDLESADALAELREELDRGGIELWLARVHAPVREMLNLTNVVDGSGETRIYPSVRTGVAAYRDRDSR